MNLIHPVPFSFWFTNGFDGVVDPVALQTDNESRQRKKVGKKKLQRLQRKEEYRQYQDYIASVKEDQDM